MLGSVVFFSVFLSFFYSLYSGRIAELGAAVLDGAASSVELALSLMGMMCFWCGIVEIAKNTGIVSRLTRLLKPIFRKIFNDYVRSYQYEAKNFIDICDYHKLMQTDTIIIHDKDSVDHERNIQIIIEDHSIVDFGGKIVGMQEKTMSKLFDLISAGLVEKVGE